MCKRTDTEFTPESETPGICAFSGGGQGFWVLMFQYV